MASEAGIEARSYSFHVAFQEFLLGLPPKRGRLTIEEYEAVCSDLQNVGGGDWPFIRDHSPERDEAFFALLRGHSEQARRMLPKLRRTREVVPDFLEHCADEILKARPDVVGFTTVYSQTWPNAALARRLKERDPDLRVVFGGASCEGPMGRPMLKAFPWVDAVVLGEAEQVLVPLIESLARGSDLAQIPDLCYRDRSGELVRTVQEGQAVEMDSVPVPDYFEYFERLERSPQSTLQIEVQMPIEFSRGCWWGAKNHCTFCGLNGSSMSLRAKSPDAAYEAALELCRRHRKHDLITTDNILPLAYFDTLLPRLAGEEIDLNFFYEVKANMKREHVALLRSAGVRSIQPGIESLSTPILALMRKGATALQNARLLKWCAEEDILVRWNLLYGFPGETAEHYGAMAEMLPSLVHLGPPSLSEVMLYRFSPYFDRPDDFGLRVDRPLPYYALLYDLDEDDLWDLAHSFEHSHLDGRAPDEYLGGLREEVERWRRDAGLNYRGLMYRRGPGFLTVTDTRTTTANGQGVLRYELDELQARAYLACDAGAKASSVATRLDFDEVRIEEMLMEFVDARLMLRDGDRFLSLALLNK